MIYQWRPGSHVPRSIDAKMAYERVASLREQGKSSPADIVEDARPDDSLLHPAFTWDDAEAGRLQRLEEARKLVQSIIVIRDEDPQGGFAPAFVSIITDEQEARQYLTVVEAAASPVFREQMLFEALNGLMAWRRRYSGLAEFADVHEAIDIMVAGQTKSEERVSE